MKRRLLLQSSVMVSAAAAYPTLASTDAWPSKPVRLVVTQAAGSGTDVIARLIADAIAPDLKQAVIVENRVGGSGIIGHEAVARSAPDGYTLLLASSASLMVVPEMNPNARYRLQDFALIAPVLSTPFIVMVANTPTAPKTLNELILRIKAEPTAYSSGGAGTLTHMCSELLLNRIGAKATHVPYKGSSQSLTDLVGGQVLFTCDTGLAMMPLFQSGRLRPLAVTGLTRLDTLPDVPTVDESGIAGYELTATAGVCAPAALPWPLVERINASVIGAQSMPTFAEKIRLMHAQILKQTPQAFLKKMQAEQPMWRKVVTDLGLRAS